MLHGLDNRPFAIGGAGEHAKRDSGLEDDFGPLNLRVLHRLRVGTVQRKRGPGVRPRRMSETGFIRQGYWLVVIVTEFGGGRKRNKSLNFRGGRN